jgi:hypothetical protein
VIVIITVILLSSMDRVSGGQTTNGRSLKEADDRFLNRFLHGRSQCRPKPADFVSRLGTGPVLGKRACNRPRLRLFLLAGAELLSRPPIRSHGMPFILFHESLGRLPQFCCYRVPHFRQVSD